jgi:hypothetical protein
MSKQNPIDQSIPLYIKEAKRQVEGIAVLEDAKHLNHYMGCIPMVMDAEGCKGLRLSYDTKDQTKSLQLAPKERHFRRPEFRRFGSCQQGHSLDLGPEIDQIEVSLTMEKLEPC